MKCSFKLIVSALLIGAAALFPLAGIGRANTEVMQEKAAEGEQETDYTEDEYNAYDAATKEPDFAKRSDMLLDMIQKYPKTTLMPHVEAAYKAMLHECSQAKQYAVLEPIAEKWLKIHPNNVQTIAYIAEAAEKLGHDQKCVECLEEIYQMEPSGAMAYNILSTYKKIKNQAKVSEWAEKVFKLPEYDADFGLRFAFVKQYSAANNKAKAAEYAKLTLKSAELVKDPSKEVQEQLHQVRYACTLLLGMNAYDDGKFAEAIKYLQQALKIEKHGEPHYYIGMSQWKQEKVEEAILSFARAELQGGDIVEQAKEKVEQLYKALHNGNTTGIEKIYRKAKEEPAE